MTREEAIEILTRYKEESEEDYYVKRAKALTMAIKALEQEPTTKNDLGVDCISRAEVLKLMQDNWHTHNGDWAMQESMDDIRALPSVTPIRPKGHWIEYSWNDNGFARWGLECDKCHKKYKYGGVMWDNPSFCPNCGADMSEVEE